MRQRREQFQAQWQQTEEGVDAGVYQLSPREIFDTYAGQADLMAQLNRTRTDIATELMVKAGLDQEAAYYAADEILLYAQETTDLSA